jgi:hypothetical protein
MMRRLASLRTPLAVVVLVAAVLAPGAVASGNPLALLAVPLEAVLAVVLLLAVPWRPARRVVAVLVATVVAATILSAALDRGFELEVAERFDPVTGWATLVEGFGVLRDGTGTVGAFLVLAGVVVGILVVIAAVTWALLRLDGAVRRRPRPALLSGGAVTAAWVVVALVGVQVVPGQPVAASEVIATTASRTDQVRTTERDAATFAASGADAPYAGLPASSLLRGLRGKDVVVAFVESYGQTAVQGTSFSPGVDRVLRAGNASLSADGYSSRSGWLDSPTFGGISWLAHSTLQTGQWIDTQQRYDEVTSGSRFTLSDAFRRAGWNTVSDIPSDSKPWATGTDFYHYGTELDATNVGYHGPRFGYAKIPDQYTWQAFDQRELEAPHKPVFAEIDLVSSHTPWTPLPHEVPWDQLGDGSVYDPQPAEGLPRAAVQGNATATQKLYGESVQYTMATLFSFLGRVNDPNLVLVVLGDHQPRTIVSGQGANHVVPISIIAKDPTVVDRTAPWGWTPGVIPRAGQPAPRMSTFRNEFLDAFDNG